MKALIQLLGGSTLIVALIFYSSLSWAYVCHKFWYWFLLPIFPNIPHISFTQSMALMMFVTLLKSHTPVNIKDEFKKEHADTIAAIITPWLSLLCGALIYFVIK